MISTLLVDDEPIALKHLSSIISKCCPQLSIAGTAKHVDEALALVEKLKPELVFLDIELAGHSSFEILEQNPQRNYEVIFVTAHDEFAIKALKHEALDYLLKPVNKAELITAIEKATLRIYKRRAEAPNSGAFKEQAKSGSHKLTLPTQEGFVFVDLDKIVFCESDGRYTRFYLADKDKKILVSRNLGEFEAILPADTFIRIHHHTIVNLKYVDKYVKGRGGYVVLANGHTLPVSSRKKEDFFDKLH